SALPFWFWRARALSRKSKLRPIFATQPRHLGAQSMQLSDLFAEPLQFLSVRPEAGQLPVFDPEPVQLPRLFSKQLVLRAEFREGLMLNCDRSSSPDNDGGAENSCFQFGYGHKIQEVEG